MIRISNAVDIGGIRAKIVADTTGFHTGIEKAKKTTRDLGDESKKTTRSLDGMASALTVIGSSAALSKLTRSIKSLVDEANKLHNAMKGLSEVAKSLKLNVGETTKTALDMAAKGFMNATEAAQAYKTALAMGLDIEQTTNLINAMADAAAYNRQAHYSWGEAIVVSMEGIKNGNSTLTDAVGVTKNLSVMQEEYAKAIGKTAATLTDAEKVQAAYNGFLSETELFAGNAKAALDGFTGTAASFEQQITQAKVAVGDGLKPVLEEVMKALTPIIADFAAWSVENKELIAGLTASAASVLALIGILATATTVVNGLRAAFLALQASTGWVGIVLAGAATITTALLTFNAASDAAADSTWTFAKNVEELNEKLNESPYKRTSDDLKKLKSDTDKLNAITEERIRLEEKKNQIIAESEREGKTAFGQEIGELNDRIAKLDDILDDFGFDNIEAATEQIRKNRKEIEKSIPALLDMSEAEFADLAAKNDKIASMETLASRYKELNALQSLDESQKQELINAANALKKAYPDLNAMMDEEGRLRITNLDIVEQQIGAERRHLDTTLDVERDRIAQMERTNKEQLKSVESQISNYEKLISVLRTVAGVQNNGTTKTSGKGIFGFIEKVLNKAYEKQVVLQKAALDIARAKAALDNGNLDTFKYKPRASSQTNDVDKDKGKGAKNSGKSAAEIAAELRKKAYDADIATVQYQADMYDWSAKKQIEAYEKVRAKHKQHLKETIEDERTLNLQLKRLHEDTVQSRFDFSAEWITQQERRMEDSYKSEVEIAKRKLESWARVRDRYKKDTEEYKRADEQMYQARKQLAQAKFEVSNEWIAKESRRMEETGKSETEIERMKFSSWMRVRSRYKKDSEFYKRADEQVYQSKKRLTSLQEKVANDLLKTQKTNVEDAKKAELKAIEEQKKAALSGYDARIKAIDDLIAKEAELNTDADYDTKLAEKRARLAVLGSAVGPEGIKEREDIAKEIERMELEHDRELRKRGLESQKQAIQDEKRTREEAFDREKADVEAKYEALRAAFEDFGGDVQTIESAISDFRVKSNEDTNAQILSDLDDFVSQYNAKLSEIQAVSAQDADLAEYNENKDAWKAAKARGDKAEMGRLKVRNEELRRKYGIAKDTGKLPSFGVGGAVPGPTGHPLLAMVHGGEAIFNQRQLSRLFALLDAPVSAMRYERSAVPAQSIVNHIDMSVNDAIFEDGADVQTLYSERGRTARRLQTMGVKTV